MAVVEKTFGIGRQDTKFVCLILKDWIDGGEADAAK